MGNQMPLDEIPCRLNDGPSEWLNDFLAVLG